jgi:hypothetical protein
VRRLERQVEHQAQVSAGTGLGSLAVVKEALEEHGRVQRGEIEAPRGVDRALQSMDEVLRQVVNFEGCVFDANAQDEFSDFTEYGLITVRTEFNDVSVKNTVFRNNLFGNEEVAGVSTRTRAKFTRFVCDHVPFSNIHFSSS